MSNFSEQFLYKSRKYELNLEERKLLFRLCVENIAQIDEGLLAEGKSITKANVSKIVEQLNLPSIDNLINEIVNARLNTTLITPEVESKDYVGSPIHKDSISALSDRMKKEKAKNAGNEEKDVQEALALVELSSLTLLEAAELTKMLEEKWGVSAAAPVAMAAISGLVAGEDVPKEEKDEFAVILKDIGPKKINVIKEVRALTGLGLKEAKEVVDNLGVVIEGADKEVAEEIKTKLEEAGAVVELK